MEAVDTTSAPNNKSKKKKLIALLILGAFAVSAGLIISMYLRYKASHISTDDAFIEGKVHVVSAKIPGTVKTVYASDNEMVKKGGLLLELEGADYDMKVREAQAGLNVEKEKLHEAEARVLAVKKQLLELKAKKKAAKASLGAAKSGLKQAESDLRRAESLLPEGIITAEKYEKAKTAYDVAGAGVNTASEQYEQAHAGLKTHEAVIKQAEASVPSEKAQIALKETVLASAGLMRSYTKIYAPADGYITKKSVHEGNQIQPAQPLMAVVPLGDVWVVANYKESQLEKIRPGQRVIIEVDAYPGKTFEGKVDSIMSGSGSAFSLFPPENATGNFVKVVQRVPVKITLDRPAYGPEYVLRVGMSVVPTILPTIQIEKK